MQYHITTSTLLGYDTTSLAHLYLESFSHSSLQILSSSFRVDGERSCTAIFEHLWRDLIGYKSGLWLWRSRTSRELCRSQPCIVLAVCLESLSYWKVNLCPSLRSWALLSRISSGSLCTFALFIFSSILTSLPVPAPEKHPHSMMLHPPCFTIGMEPGFLQRWCLAFRPNS